MKKLSLLVAIALIFAISLSTFAGTFPDLDPDHWAYEHIQKLAVSGVLEGYPDGFFKGDRDLTRYEFAAALRRALDNIDKERQFMYKEIDTLADDVNRLKRGLTIDQVEQIEEVIKVMLQREEPGLSEEELDKKAEEITKKINELSSYFEEELVSIQEQIDEINNKYEDITSKLEELKEKDVEEIEELEAEIKKLSQLLEAQTQLGNTRYRIITEEIEELESELNAKLEEHEERIIALEMVRFDKPTYDADYMIFTLDGDPDDVYENPFYADGDIELDTIFEHRLGMGLIVENEVFRADLDLGIDLDNRFTRDDFTEDDPDDGFGPLNHLDIEANIEANSFNAQLKRGLEPLIKPYLFDGETAINGIEANFGNNKMILSSDILATQLGLQEVLGIDVMENDINFLFAKNLYQADTLLMGVNTEFDITDFTVKPEFAFNNAFENPFFKVEVEREELALFKDMYFEFVNDQGIVAIEGTDGFDSGYLFSTEIDVLDRLFVQFEDKADTVFNLEAEQEFAGFENELDFEARIDDGEQELDYRVSRDLITDILNASAEIKFETNEDLKQKYQVNYTPGLVGASVTQYINDHGNATVFETDFNKDEDFTLSPMANLVITPGASLLYTLDGDMNYEIKVDAEKQYTDTVLFTGYGLLAEKEFSVEDGFVPGNFRKYGFGIDYDVSELIDARVNYDHLIFDDAADNDDFDLKKIIGVIGVTF